MYICICNGVTDHQIREAAEAGCGSLTELTMRTGGGKAAPGSAQRTQQGRGGRGRGHGGQRTPA